MDTHPASPTHEIHPLFAARFSPYAFKSTPIPSSALWSMIEAARWASSSFNEQPWRYIIGNRSTDEASYDALLACLVPANQAWARTAPALAIACATTQYKRNGRENDKCWHDLGQANAAFALQATALGLQVHPMGGFDAGAARKAFDLPENIVPHVAFAIGEPGPLDVLPSELAERVGGPRTRLDTNDLLLRGNL